MRSALVIVGAGLVLLACSDPLGTISQPPVTRTTTIAVGDNYFDPPVDTVSAGVAVMWLWGLDQNLHNVTWDTGPTVPSPSADMTTGGYQIALPAGTYTYHCTHHGTAATTGNPMVGTLVVEAP